jgi:hypothetical protein
VDPTNIDSPYVSSPTYNPSPYNLSEHSYPPALTVLSAAGTVPSLYLLAKVAGGGRGLMFERMVDLDMDDTLLQVTFHSISNRITPKY